jgi:alcohol dehydrogenase
VRALIYEKLWTRNVTITTGLVDTYSTPTLLSMVTNGSLDPVAFATHHFSLSEMEQAYDVFGDAAHTNALKVVIRK